MKTCSYRLREGSPKNRYGSNNSLGPQPVTIIMVERCCVCAFFFYDDIVVLSPYGYAYDMDCCCLKNSKGNAIPPAAGGV